MKLVLALFELTELDELTAVLYDLESGAALLRVDDDRTDRRPFQERVKEAAAANGYEIQEWDRSALHA
jgi:hypothetical protein